MELSMNFGGVEGRYGLEGGVKLLKEAGFDAIDYGLGCMVDNACIFNTDAYKEEAARIRKVIEDGGLHVNRTHAPFTFRKWDDEDNYNNVIYPRILRSIEVSALLGAKVVVVHPLHHFVYHGHEEEIFEKNMEFYRSLIPYCREWNIKVGVENMYQVDPRRKHIVFDTCGVKEEFVRYIDTLDSEWMVATLDIGHVGLPLQDDEPWDFIRALGHDRLHSLHVHDNDYKGDGHTLPFLGKIDWMKVTEALGEINYDGDFTYEANFMGNPPDGFKHVTAKYMADVGRYLMSEIEKNRKLD